MQLCVSAACKSTSVCTTPVTPWFKAASVCSSCKRNIPSSPGCLLLLYPELQLINGLQPDLLLHKAASCVQCCVYASAGKLFRGMDATGPNNYIYIETDEVKQLIKDIIDKQGYQVMCSGRQTGKSTVGQAVEHRLIELGIAAVYVEPDHAVLHIESVSSTVC
jgi:hypothetical protein